MNVTIDVKSILTLTEPYDEKNGDIIIISTALLNYVHDNPNSMAHVLRFMLSNFWKNLREVARNMIYLLKLRDENVFLSVFINNKDIVEIYKREALLLFKDV